MSQANEPDVVSAGSSQDKRPLDDFLIILEGIILSLDQHCLVRKLFMLLFFKVSLQKRKFYP